MHYHNGTAEQAIQTVTSMACTMMLHSAIHWPDVANSTLWPMAVTHAVYLYNHMPSLSTGISPVNLLTKTRWEQQKFHDTHVWGCPVYILDKLLSDGKKLPCWQQCSKWAMNMGNSPKYTSTVPLVLNPDTGAITAPFHVVFDDWFGTVVANENELSDLQTEEWTSMFGELTYHILQDNDDAAKPMQADETFTHQTKMKLLMQWMPLYHPHPYQWPLFRKWLHHLRLCLLKHEGNQLQLHSQ